MGQVSKYFAISRFFSWKTSLPHPRTAIPSHTKFLLACRRHITLKAPLCKGSWHGAAVTEGLTAIIMIKFHLAFGGAGPFTRLN